MSHLRRRQGSHRLDEIGHLKGRPKIFRRAIAGFIERKGAMYSLSLSVNPFDGLRESDNDPNCALSDRLGGVGPLGLHKPLRPCSTRPGWRRIGGGLRCCHWSSGGWRAGSSPRSSDRRGNRIFGGVASTPPPPPGTYYGYPAYGYPGYAQPGYAYPGYSGYPAYSGPPGYVYPGYPGQPGYPAYSGPSGSKAEYISTFSGSRTIEAIGSVGCVG